ncbi:MAG: extracellular solute-binding protein [Oscillospiraceae bacterium]|nr:extracellular solute-binding protein [Oscillospiraceae bacterium]
MKRLALCMAIFMSAILLTSCKGGEDVPEEREIDGKKVITIARSEEQIWQRGNNTKRLIAGFTSKNKDYVIEEHIYESSDKLLVEIFAGNQPDLICLGDWIDATPLYGKELLCDMYEFIDGDPDISRGDYVEPVLKVLETNGRLYQMPFDFGISSAVVKASVWGDDKDTSFEHIVEVSEKNGCKTPFDFTIDSYYFMPYISSNFIDFETGTCNFTDGRFEEILTFMKPAAELMADCETSEELHELFADGDILVLSSGIAGFTQLNYLESDYGEEIKFIGFPSETENYHIVIPAVSFAVFSDAKQKQGAFEFIKYCTSYDAYTTEIGGSIGGTCLPINKAALENCYEKEMEFEKLIYPNMDEEHMTQNFDEILEQIYSVNGASSPVGNVIFPILSEETQMYFSGKKSAAEVCEIIQNRLSTYFNEQRS